MLLTKLKYFRPSSSNVNIFYFSKGKGKIKLDLTFIGMIEWYCSGKFSIDEQTVELNSVSASPNEYEKNNNNKRVLLSFSYIIRDNKKVSWIDLNKKCSPFSSRKDLNLIEIFHGDFPVNIN